MNTKRMATVFLVTVGAVLVPGVANAATGTTVTPSTTTVDPIFVLAGGTPVTVSDGSTDTSASSVTDVSPPAASDGSTDAGAADKKAQHDAEEAAKKAQHDAEEEAKKRQHDAEEAAKKAQHDAEEAAKKANKAPKGQVKNDTTLTSSTMSWTGDPSLFDGQGRKFG